MRFFHHIVIKNYWYQQPKKSNDEKILDEIYASKNGKFPIIKSTNRQWHFLLFYANKIPILPSVWWNNVAEVGK